MRSIILLLFVLFMSSCTEIDSPLDVIMQSDKKEIKAITASLSKHAVQIRYTQIERDSSNRPHFKSYDFGVNEARYFYPASTAKLPVAALALQRIRELQRQGVPIDMETRFRVIDPKNGRIIIEQDSTHPTNEVTVAHLIKKIFLVSDNDAYNYLFDFLGRDYINQELEKKGFTDIQIHHKFLFGADNVNSWVYEFFKGEKRVYHQKSQRSKYAKSNADLEGVFKGEGYLDNGELKNSPMDFSHKNRVSIYSLEGLLRRLMFPEVFPESHQFGLQKDDYTFLRYWMSRTTLESTSPRYTEAEGYYDSYVKFLIYGDQPGKMNPTIRVFNKVGDAYGTLTDTAYVVDHELNIEFLLTATVFVNANEIFNDNNYEYDELGFPFLGALGRQILQWEQKRKQAHRPAL